MIETHYEELKLQANAYFSYRYAKRNNKKTWHIKNHYSKSLEIILYEKISGSLYMEGGQTPLENKSVLMMPPYQVHGFDMDAGSHNYHILHVIPDLMPEALRFEDIPDRPVYQTLDDDAMDFLSQVISQIDLSRSIKLKEHLVSLLVHWLISNMYEPTKRERSKVMTYKDRFMPLLKYLDYHGIYTMHADQAAILCNLSKSHFFTLFKACFGKTYVEFMKERQTNQAKHLLATTDMSVTEIGQTLGYCDGSYFTKSFKCAVNLTPRQYRNRE